jgi:3-oxoacyl-[acyl-carrier-protein] synthase-1
MEIGSLATTYIANCGLITAAGGNALMNFAAYRAGINTYQAANYHSSDHHQVTLALVPDGALPPLAESIEEAELLSFRDERLLQMTQAAAQEALAHYRGEPMPLILAGPENYPGVINQLPSNFLSVLKTQVDLPVLYHASRTIGTGRTGVLEALRLAHFYLSSGQHDHVLVGGVDSCQHSAWLNFLDSTERLKSASPHRRADTFVPGEGAAFLLLTNDPACAMTAKGLAMSLAEPGFSEEPGHIYSEAPYRGEGLDVAVKQALNHLPEPHKIGCLFSSSNGESYWAKELGVAVTRSSASFDNMKHQHPADCFGDLGAATGAALIALAAYSNFKIASPTNTLICTSSDSAYRAAVCLIPERIPA